MGNYVQYMYLFVYFRLYSGARDTSVSSALYSPALKKVFESNVNNNTFGNWIENMEKTLQQPNRAFFYITSIVQNNEAYKCKVNMKKYIIRKNPKLKVKFGMLFSLMKYEKKIIMKKQISFYLIHYFFTHESQFFSA